MTFRAPYLADFCGCKIHWKWQSTQPPPKKQTRRNWGWQSGYEAVHWSDVSTWRGRLWHFQHPAAKGGPKAGYRCHVQLCKGYSFALEVVSNLVPKVAEKTVISVAFGLWKFAFVWSPCWLFGRHHTVGGMQHFLTCKNFFVEKWGLDDFIQSPRKAFFRWRKHLVS